MMILSTEETEELLDRDDITVYPSLYAHLAYATRDDETPLDTLVRAYYLGCSGIKA